MCNGRGQAIVCPVTRSGARYVLTEDRNDVFRIEDPRPAFDSAIVFRRDTRGEASFFQSHRGQFRKLSLGEEDGTAFRINPLQPIGVLRTQALKAKPPKEKGDFLKADLVDVTMLDSTIKLDIRYAGTNNFLGVVFYSQAKALLQRPAAEALVRAHRNLKRTGYGLLIHDAYRPWYVTKMFWDATPNEQKIFVADPSKGSRHNRGCAVDLSLYDVATGMPVAMVSGYDEFSHRAFPDYPGGTSLQRWHRDLLRQAMDAEGFRVYDWEWWHFDYKDWKRYPIGTATFEEIR
ncbi:MAG: M15 family metallopeptidase [Bacteroidota bacterium]